MEYLNKINLKYSYSKVTTILLYYALEIVGKRLDIL